MFKYVEDKDMFQCYYHKMLCRRLVTDASASEEAERSMIAKLKHMCGFEYTNKIERLLTDVALSRDTSDHFRQVSNLDFCITIICFIIYFYITMFFFFSIGCQWKKK